MKTFSRSPSPVSGRLTRLRKNFDVKNTNGGIPPGSVSSRNTAVHMIFEALAP